MMNTFSLKHIFSSVILAIIIVCSFATSSKAQTSPRRNSVNPLPSQDDSVFTVRVDFRYGRGLEKGQSGNAPRIILPSLRAIMQQFSINDADVSAFVPGFNEADTIMRHPDGYTYRAPNYAHSLRIRCNQTLRKAEFINAISALSEIYNVQELPKIVFRE